MRYLALGDSYTIGTGASDSARSWPAIVARRLEKKIKRQVELFNPAVNGFTTLDLIDKELSYVNELKPDLVSVLIGVNDLVCNRSADEYRSSLVTIYDAIASLRLPEGRVLAVSIPNWSAVPAAREFGEPTFIRATTNSFNAVAREEAAMRGFTWVDITVVSTSGLGSPGWISTDNLHPGDAQYSAWAAVIWERVDGVFPATQLGTGASAARR
jgi:lysophospholipase L1-like esterase